MQLCPPPSGDTLLHAAPDPARGVEAMDGKNISRYEIIERMGAGGMGVVYRARDPRLDRIVAIKFLSAELSSDPAAKTRFIQEAKAASALDHPNICAIHEIDEADDGRLYIVMAYCDGRTLGEIVAERSLPVSDALAVAVQIADGLAKAHTKGIVHRDLKPSNVMLTNDGVAKILDFGLAKVAGAAGVTRTGHSAGTPAYMSPEQIRGETVDHRADIWALGVMLFEVMTGEHPFRGEHAQAVMYSVVNEVHRPLSDVWPDAPAGVQEIIDRCLQKDPTARYQQMSQLRDDLRVVLERARGSTASYSASDAYASTVAAALRIEREERRRTRGARARRGAVAVLAVVGLAAVVWGGIQYFGRPGEALRVLVLPPVVEAKVDTTTAELVASNVEVALMRGLIAMKEVSPLEYAGAATSPQDAAAEAAADEVVSVSLHDTGREWQVSLKRLRGADGSVIWAGDFNAPHDEPLLLANTTLARLANGYADRARGDATMTVSAGDYLVFLRQYDRFDRFAGGKGGADRAMIDSLQAVRQRSPQFVDAYLLESKVARYLFEVTRDPTYLEQARNAAREAQIVAPDDARVLVRAFDAAIAAGDIPEARASIEALRRMDPGNIAILRQEAQVARKEGDTERALTLMRNVVARRPARLYVQELADLERALGHYADARVHLNELLERFPNDRFAQSKLAEVELLYGDASAAERLYNDLVARFPGAVVITNLALAKELLGKYDEAASDFREAIALSPADATGYLNLADCEKMAGRGAAADSLYRHVLVLIDADPNPQELTNLRMRAQSLGHLGNKREAVTAIQEAFRKDPENAWTLYAASVVYTAIGEHTSALVNARAAIDKGVQARWFGIALFDSLRGDPEFVALISQDPIVSRSDSRR